MPVGLGVVTGKQFPKTLRAIQKIPVTRYECVDTEMIEDIHHHLAFRVQGLGGALDCIAGVDEQGIWVLRPYLFDSAVQVSEPPKLLAVIRVALAKVGAGDQMAMDIAHVDQGNYPVTGEER